MPELPSKMVQGCADDLRDVLTERNLGLNDEGLRRVATGLLTAAHVPELLEALRWYADEDNWWGLMCDDDIGGRGRAALERAGVRA